MTKEEKKVYMKEWRAKNKDKISIHNKKYRDKHKEKQSNYIKQWVNENPNYHREYRESVKDGYHRVYLLKDYNYVGCTGLPLYRRFNHHKYEFGRDCTNYEILFKSTDRDEALRVEAQYHDMGYEGRHINNLYK